MTPRRNGYLKLWNGASDSEEITYGDDPYAITPAVYIDGEIPVTINIEYNDVLFEVRIKNKRYQFGVKEDRYERMNYFANEVN